MKKHIIKCDGVTQIIHADNESQAESRFKHKNPLVNNYASLTIKVK